MWKYTSYRLSDVNQLFCHTRCSRDVCVIILNLYLLRYLFRVRKSRIGRMAAEHCLMALNNVGCPVIYGLDGSSLGGGATAGGCTRHQSKRAGYVPISHTLRFCTAVLGWMQAERSCTSGAVGELLYTEDKVGVLCLHHTWAYYRRQGKSIKLSSVCRQFI